jgi:hypothetical protein
VAGALHLADRAVLKGLVNTAVPLFRCGGDVTKIIVSPLLRYISSKCCDNKEHITNFGEKRYFERMGEGLGDIVDWIKESAHSKRLRNFKVLCPNRMLRMGEDEENSAKRVRTYWDQDLVLMSWEGYKNLAKVLTEKLADIATAETTETTAPSPAVHQQQQQSQQYKKKTSWLTTDDAIAQRVDDRFRGGWGRGAHGRSTDWRGSPPYRGGGRRPWDIRGRSLGGPRFGPY